MHNTIPIIAVGAFVAAFATASPVPEPLPYPLPQPHVVKHAWKKYPNPIIDGMNPKYINDQTRPGVRDAWKNWCERYPDDANCDKHDKDGSLKDTDKSADGDKGASEDSGVHGTDGDDADEESGMSKKSKKESRGSESSDGTQAAGSTKSDDSKSAADGTAGESSSTGKQDGAKSGKADYGSSAPKIEGGSTTGDGRDTAPSSTDGSKNAPTCMKTPCQVGSKPEVDLNPDGTMPKSGSSQKEAGKAKKDANSKPSHGKIVTDGIRKAMHKVLQRQKKKEALSKKAHSPSKSQKSLAVKESKTDPVLEGDLEDEEGADVDAELDFEDHPSSNDSHKGRESLDDIYADDEEGTSSTEKSGESHVAKSEHPKPTKTEAPRARPSEPERLVKRSETPSMPAMPVASAWGS